MTPLQERDLYRQTGRGRSLRAWILDDYPRVHAEHSHGP